MQKKYLVLQITSKRKEKDQKMEEWLSGYDEQKAISKTNYFYEWLTDYFFYEDIYCYSEKEFFIDITNYPKL